MEQASCCVLGILSKSLLTYLSYFQFYSNVVLDTTRQQRVSVSVV